MHPETARSLVAHRRGELLTRAPGEQRRPRWRVNWTHATLPPSEAAGRPGRSWVIIISATTRGA